MSKLFKNSGISRKCKREGGGTKLRSFCCNEQWRIHGVGQWCPGLPNEKKYFLIYQRQKLVKLGHNWKLDPKRKSIGQISTWKRKLLNKQAKKGLPCYTKVLAIFFYQVNKKVTQFLGAPKQFGWIRHWSWSISVTCFFNSKWKPVFLFGKF